MEHTRLQLEAAAGALAGDEDAAAVRTEVQRVSGIATALEGRLVDVNLTGAREASGPLL